MLWWYHILDVFFMVFHALVTLFNLLGWAWKKTRLANLILLALTGASWSLLGMFYGWGYCPLTDWHFHVLEKLGTPNLPNSYIKYMLDRIFHTSLNANMVDRWTLILFLLALVISVTVNIRDRRRRKLV